LVCPWISTHPRFLLKKYFYSITWDSIFREFCHQGFLYGCYISKCDESFLYVPVGKKGKKIISCVSVILRKRNWKSARMAETMSDCSDFSRYISGRYVRKLEDDVCIPSQSVLISMPIRAHLTQTVNEETVSVLIQ
jgi:hypothetical protein